MVAQILQSDPRAYRSAILALGRFDVRSRLAQIRRPTLIVTGSDDTTVSPANQRELLAIPGSQQVILPGAGHGLIADHPAEFNRVLLQFLQEV
jgi:pimeloyl-ACP methyl ester carboxylesterase